MTRAQGKKVRKQVFIGTNTTTASSTTYYVYDAMGTLMAVYKNDATTNVVSLSEAPINAPGRIGMWRFGATDKPHDNNPIADGIRVYDRSINKKLYELTDQTGNVRAVVGDTKRWVGTETVPSVPMSANNYPYGMAQAGRVASAGADYRYGYNGMEEEDRGEAVSTEIASTGAKAKPGEANLLNTEFRLYDPRLGQWLTRDAVFQPWESPYSAMAGNPILFSDPQGLNETTSNGRVENGEVIVEADRIPGAVTPPPSVDVSQYGKNEIRDLPSTVGKDGRNYTNVNGQEVRYVPYAGGETRDFEYSFTLDGVKMWKAFAPLSNGEANARRLRTRLNAIDDYRNITTAALLTPFLLTGIGELAFSYEIGSIGLATRAAAYSTGGALASNPNTRQVVANQSSNIVQWAQSLQGNQYYPGVDQFREITLKAGTQVVGGARADGSTGQFFTTINGALRSGLTMSGYQNGVQIRYAYNELQVYEVVQTTQAAFGQCLANPNVTTPPSMGGLPQIVIQNGATVLRPLYKVILDP